MDVVISILSLWSNFKHKCKIIYTCISEQWYNYVCQTASLKVMWAKVFMSWWICNNIINKFFCNWTQLFSFLFVGNKEIVSVDWHLILIVNQSISREWNMFTSTMQWRFYIPVSDLIFFMESITEIPEQENGDLSFCSYSSIIEKCSIYIPVNIIICYKQFWLQPWKYHFCKVTWLLNLH